MSLLKIAGRVRGLFAGNYAENKEDEQFVINNRGDQCIAQSLPPLTELVRLGNTWQVALSTGLAALTALPTTTAGLSLFNGEPAQGASYIIESFGSWEGVVDATQTDVTAVFAMMNVTPVATPAATALSIRSTSGRAYGGKARPVSAATVTNDGWFAHGTSGQMAAAAAGANWKVNEAQTNGLYLVPPGGMFNVQSVKAAAAAAAQQFFFIRWHEAQLIYKS